MKNTEMVFGDDARGVLRWQLRLTWRFAEDFVIGRVDDVVARWRPAAASPTIHPIGTQWAADWPVEEPGVTPAPATIGWILWHIEWWWSDVLALVRGLGPIDPEGFVAAGGTSRIVSLKEQWDDVLAQDDLARRIGWVMPEPQPLARIAAWVNFELAKNLSEINQVLMLRATAQRD